MKRLILLTGLVVLPPAQIGCRGVTTTTYPRVPNAHARSFRENGHVWVELKLENPSPHDPWRIAFEHETPEGLKVLADPSSTRFLWIASQERIRFFGNHGYRLSLRNSTQTYDLLLTLRPNYAVVLEILMEAVGHG